MSCKHPLKGFVIGLNENGKQNIKVASYNTDHIEITKDGKVIKVDTPNTTNNLHRRFNNWIELPCGQCIGCRLEKTRQWANRIILECDSYRYNYFVTLTYDDSHLPLVGLTDDVTGEYLEIPNLDKRDYTLFLKRLRERYEDLHKNDAEKIDTHIRYFGCGEYGDSTYRSHYHFIFLNLDIPDLELHHTEMIGDVKYNMYTSKWLESIWEKGNVLIGQATWETIAYTARYVTKKLTGERAKEYSKLGIEPPFCTMSRRPGLARKYYDENKEKLFSQNHYYVQSGFGTRPATPCRYFRDLYDIDNPLQSGILKEDRKLVAEVKKDMRLDNTDVDYLRMLQIEENTLMEKSKALKREL